MADKPRIWQGALVPRGTHDLEDPGFCKVGMASILYVGLHGGGGRVPM